MKKLILLLIVIALCSCSSTKKTTQAKSDRYHDFSGFTTNKVKPMWTGW